VTKLFRRARGIRVAKKRLRVGRFGSRRANEREVLALQRLQRGPRRRTGGGGDPALLSRIDAFDPSKCW
jgi:hypothetical protein